MANTYSIASARDYRPAMVEQPATSIAGHPYLADNTAVIGVFNRSDSNRILRLKAVTMRDVGMNTLSGFSLFQLQRITAYVSGSDIEITKLDSNNTSLPSQIVALEDVSSVTVSSSSVIRRGINAPEYNITRQLASFTSAVLGERKTGMSNANTYINHNNTEVQNFVLREGEGIALTPVANAIAYTMKFLVNVMFNVGSQTYFVSVNITTEPRPNFVLFNNTGSGEVIEVLSIEIAENGTDEFPAIFTIEPIDYMDITTGETVNDLASFDSTNESLTGLIDILVSPRVHLAGYDSGAFMQRNILRRFAGTNSLAAPDVALGAFNFASRRIDTDKNELSDIVLRPGEGFGLFKRNGSGIGKFGLNIVFTIETDSVPAGGEFGFGFS